MKNKPQHLEVIGWLCLRDEKCDFCGSIATALVLHDGWNKLYACNECSCGAKDQVAEVFEKALKQKEATET